MLTSGKLGTGESEAELNDEGEKERKLISGLVNPQYYPAITQRVAQGVHAPPRNM